MQTREQAMTQLCDQFAYQLYRCYKARSRAHNVEGVCLANVRRINNASLRPDHIRVESYKVTLLPELDALEKPSLADILDQRDASRIARLVRKAILSGRRQYSIVRVNQQFAETIQGKQSPCLLRITPLREPGAFEFRAWHTNGLTALFLAASLCINSPRKISTLTRASCYLGGALAIGSLAFYIFKSLGADTGQALACAISISLLPLEKARELLKHSAVDSPHSP